MTTYYRKGFRFDTCQMISNISDIVTCLGLDLDLEKDFYRFTQDFIQVTKVDPSTGNLENWRLPSGAAEFQACLQQHFPDSRNQLADFFKYSQDLFYEIYRLKYQPGPLDIAAMFWHCPKVLRNLNRTFTQYLRAFHLNDPDLDLIFQVFSGMCGLPNDRVAAILSVGVMFSLLEMAVRPVGPFSLIPQKMQDRFHQLGGQILFKTEVVKILVEDGSVRGVLLKDSREFLAANVISTADVKTTLEKMVGREVIGRLSPAYLRQLDRVKMTTSTFTVGLGIDEADFLRRFNLPGGYTLLTSGNDAFQRLYSGFENNRSSLNRDCFFIGLNCPPIGEETPPVLVLQVIPQPEAGWGDLRQSDRAAYHREKEKFADNLIALVEQRWLTGLRSHIVYRDISTPATFSRYSGSPLGSISDMASTPDNFGPRRLPVQTPVHGLLLPKFAHGAFGALNSGLQAADILLEGKVMRGYSRFSLKNSDFNTRKSSVG